MGESLGDVYLLNFDKMCRLCMAQSTEFVYIFQQFGIPDNLSIQHRIRDCLTVNVSQNDGLPPNICKNCHNKLIELYDFKNISIESDSNLRQQLSRSLSSNVRQDVNNLPVCDGYVKVEGDENSDLYIKSEDEGLRDNDSFSESDDTPLSKVKIVMKQMKHDQPRQRGEKKERKRVSTTRGRAPKAKPLCLICNQKFSRFTELIEHQNEVHNVQYEGEGHDPGSAGQPPHVVVFRCHVCKEHFEGRDDLRSHCKMKHNTKVIQPYPCSHCDRQFPSWGLLVIHERKHTGDKPFSCDVCGKQNFISQTSLRRHKLMHLKVYSCRECGRDFNCDSALKAHIRCKHTNERPYLCNVCGRSFSLSAILVAHMTSHSTERKYVCDVCGFASKTSGNHYRHKNTHKTGGVKSFHCETCGKAFDSKLKLSSHQIIHRPVRPHVCKMCGKAFLYNNKLERHILLVHARERPFPCPLCGKKLASKFGLGIHLKTHNRNEHSQGHVTPHVSAQPQTKLEPLDAMAAATLHGVLPATMAPLPPSHTMLP